MFILVVNTLLRVFMATICDKRFTETNYFIEKLYRHSIDVINSVFNALIDMRNFSHIGKVIMFNLAVRLAKT